MLLTIFLAIVFCAAITILLISAVAFVQYDGTNACFSDGWTIETRMRKEKKKFLRIEMLVVRKEYQGQGYMGQMMDYAYALADERRIPVILDTDDRDKAARYEHLGMKLDRMRSCGEQFHMYDLIREYKERQ